MCNVPDEVREHIVFVRKECFSARGLGSEGHSRLEHVLGWIDSLPVTSEQPQYVMPDKIRKQLLFIANNFYDGDCWGGYPVTDEVQAWLDSLPDSEAFESAKEHNTEGWPYTLRRTSTLIDFEVEAPPDSIPKRIPNTDWYVRILPDGTAQIIEGKDPITVRQEARNAVKEGTRITVEEAERSFITNDGGRVTFYVQRLSSADSEASDDE